jgi:hypothetical protein
MAAAKQEAAIMGVPLDVSPHEALLQCIRITAGEVAYCNMQIQELNSVDEVVEHPLEVTEQIGGEGGGFTQTKMHTPQLNIWVRTRQLALERLAKFSKMALDAGVNERRVQIAEGMAQMLAPVLKAIFDDLQLSAAQKKKAPGILRQHLLELERETQLVPEEVG